MHTGEGSRAPVLPAVQVSSGHQVRPGSGQVRNQGNFRCILFSASRVHSCSGEFWAGGAIEPMSQITGHRLGWFLTPASLRVCDLRRQSAAAYVPVWQHFERVNGFLAGVQLYRRPSGPVARPSGIRIPVLRRICRSETDRKFRQRPQLGGGPIKCQDMVK